MVEANPVEEVKEAKGGLKIAILGATGAIGKEIVHYAKNDNRVGELILIVRRTLDEW